MNGTNSLNEHGVFEPFDAACVPHENAAKGSRFALSFQQLGKFGGGSQVGVSMEVLPPGKQANPAHFHLLEEEHVFVLEGDLTLLLGDRQYAMPAGHYVCFPAGQKVGHALVNRSAQPCRYLIIGNPRPEDVAIHTETGRVSVKLLGEAYRRSATMAYWEGVDVDAAP